MFSKPGTEFRLTAILLMAGAVIAWLVTLTRMRGMDMGPGKDLGGLGWFAGVWTVMMAAMMLPSLVPMAGTYAGQARAGSDAEAPRALMQTALFVGGYLVTWILIGLAAWALVTEARSLDVSFLAWDDGGRYFAGAVIAAAGLYELTPLKASCLRRCRDRGLLVADWCGGLLGAARMGLAQGTYCIGGSWALMAALFALGVMSITWMVVIAAVIAMEKLLPRAALTSRAAATLLLALAAGVALVPEHLPGLTIRSERTGTTSPGVHTAVWIEPTAPGQRRTTTRQSQCFVPQRLCSTTRKVSGIPIARFGQTTASDM